MLYLTSFEVEMIFFCQILLFLFLMNTLLFAYPKVSENIVAYPISGKTGLELQQQMNTLGPKSHTHQFHASTQWFITWQYGYQFKDDVCQLTSVQVNLHIIYQYPHWINYQNSNKTLQKKWDMSLQGLQAHEEGHGKNGKFAAIAIEKALQNISPKNNCSQLMVRVDETANHIINEHLHQDLLYDLLTQHGQA